MVELTRLTRLLPMSPQAIEQAADMIKAGGLVAYPTDTVYGLGCDPFNGQAVLRLVRAKSRAEAALPVLVNSLKRATELANLDESALRLAKQFWPGALTIVVPTKAMFPHEVTGHSETVGLRIPGRADTLELIRQAGGAIVGTSANSTGQPASKAAGDVLKSLGDRLDILLDGGPSTLGIESTIVRVHRGSVSILRESAIAGEEIVKTMKLRPDGTP